MNPEGKRNYTHDSAFSIKSSQPDSQTNDERDANMVISSLASIWSPPKTGQKVSVTSYLRIGSLSIILTTNSFMIKKIRSRVGGDQINVWSSANFGWEEKFELDNFSSGNSDFIGDKTTPWSLVSMQRSLFRDTKR